MFPSRIICLVPSLTETLIEAGVEVVGRTRFCIHPSDKVKSIAVVGGTKNIDWDKVKSLDADLLILDKEENPKFFADESPIEHLALHVENVRSCGESLKILSEKLNSNALLDYAHRFGNLKRKKIDLDKFVEWVTPPKAKTNRIEYIIWRNPLMAVGKNTYIGSVLQLLGYELSQYETKYPKLSEKLESDRIYLFSSEPYPFFKHKEWIKSCEVPAGLVNGESFSWFGIRSLRFLESL